mgnify:CR=1 FL=1
MTYQSAYPNARILFADEKSFKADNRVNFFNQIKNNDYDCVIMSHDQFGKIPQSPEMQQQILQAELDTVEENLEVLKQQTLGKGAVSVKLPKVSAGNGSESYRIRPYKGKKFYSGASFSVDPTLPAVKNVKAVQTAEGISVTWSPVAGADYYEVYRARQDSFTYDKTTKTYQVNAGYLPKVVEANFKDTSAGVSLLPVSSSVQYGYTYSAHFRKLYRNRSLA